MDIALETTVQPDRIEMLSEFTDIFKLHKNKKIVLQCSYDTSFHLTPTTLKYVCINYGNQTVFSI